MRFTLIWSLTTICIVENLPELSAGLKSRGLTFHKNLNEFSHSTEMSPNFSQVAVNAEAWQSHLL